MDRGASTDERVESGHVELGSALASAAELVGEADELVAEVLTAGRWPQQATVERFLEGDRLQRVLSLYSRAMQLDPDESAYPWNLASTLNRLGLNDLALGFMTRAIHVAQQTVDTEWAGADAYVALAEIAIAAREPEVALTALARAQASGSGVGAEQAVAGLLREIRNASDDPNPERSLVALLEQLPS